MIILIPIPHFQGGGLAAVQSALLVRDGDRGDGCGDAFR
jgi:hypothetical protein